MATKTRMPHRSSAGASEEVILVGPTVDQLLAKNPRLARSDIEHLQQWLAKQPHMPRLLDEELVPFLVSNNYSLERAKECVDKAFTMRTQAPELFTGRDPEDPENIKQFEAFRVARLPKPTPDGRRMVVMGYSPAASFDPTRFDGLRSTRLSTALMELVALEEAVAQGGAPCDDVVLLLDAHHVTLQHLARTPLGPMQRLMAFVQEAAPLKISAVHLLRLGAMGEKVFNMVKPLMSEELKNMMFFHSMNLTEFHKEFPPEILPEEFGGTCGTLSEYHHNLVDRLRSLRPWVLAQEARVVDESLRPADAPRRDLFGTSGSFRKLDFD